MSKNPVASIVILGTFLAMSFGSLEAARAEDHFLTIGGGYSLTGNQVSLEKNVFYFRRLLATVYGDQVSHQVLFSDGDDPARDLQFNDTTVPLPRVNDLLSRIHRQTKDVQYAYRSHQVDNLFGASSRESLNHWFEKVGAGLTSGDRLVIYATAHGGKGGKGDEATNTRLYLWNRQSISMREFSELLDQVNPDVPVVLVMVQCYAGGFADLIFEGGKKSEGLSDHNRCGFFATVHDRGAAGCTADIKEEDYREYSTYFMAALLGETRLGSPVEQPDFDQSGTISFEEAHAYALLTSTTVDISIKTSDAFLREYSRLESEENESLLTPHSPISELLAAASPANRAVIEGLSAQLGLAADDRAAAAEDLAKELKDAQRSIGRQRNRASRGFNRHSDSIKSAVLKRWPELSNPWNPQAQLAMSNDADEITNVIESHGSFREFEEAENEMAELSAEATAKDRDWVKCQRLLRELENVALQANLAQTASEELVARYQLLLQAERQTLGATRTAALLPTGEQTPVAQTNHGGNE